MFDPNDSRAIEKRRDISALVPVTVGAFADFIDQQLTHRRRERSSRVIFLLQEAGVVLVSAVDSSRLV